MEDSTHSIDDELQNSTPIPASSEVEEHFESCVICLSAISERAITVPCNHYSFDFICLVSWLQERSACPLCNTDVTEVQYDFCSPTDYKSFPVKSTQTTPDSHDSAPPLASNPRARFNNPSRPPRRRHQPAPTADTALLRRRHVYKHDLYSLHVGSNRVSRYQTLTPALITNSPELQTRARTWIRRELRVFSYLNSDPVPDETASSSINTGDMAPSARRASNAEFLLSYILAILRSVDLKAPSGQAEDMLAEFLGRPHARLFLHELGAWLRSPFARLEDWDRNVQYAEPLSDECDESRSSFGHGRRRGKSRQQAERTGSPYVHDRSAWREREAVRRYAPD